MSIQGQFDQEALDMLPKITNIIQRKGEFENVGSIQRNEIINRTLRDICNSNIALNDMTAEQIIEFENIIIKKFKYYGWL